MTSITSAASLLSVTSLRKVSTSLNELLNHNLDGETPRGFCRENAHNNPQNVFAVPLLPPLSHRSMAVKAVVDLTFDISEWHSSTEMKCEGKDFFKRAVTCQSATSSPQTVK